MWGLHIEAGFRLRILKPRMGFNFGPLNSQKKRQKVTRKTAPNRHKNEAEALQQINTQSVSVRRTLHFPNGPRFGLRSPMSWQVFCLEQLQGSPRRTQIPPDFRIRLPPASKIVTWYTMTTNNSAVTALAPPESGSHSEACSRLRFWYPWFGCSCSRPRVRDIILRLHVGYCKWLEL